MPHLLSLNCQFPNTSYPQEILSELIVKTFDPSKSQIIRKIHKASGVNSRHLSLPLESFVKLSGMGERMHVWQEVAQSLGSHCIKTLLKNSQINPQDIGHFFFTSITGMSAPSIDALLVDELNLSVNIKRTPIFGLGCLGGAALISRAADHVKAYPKSVALGLAVELCTLTWQKDDNSMANIIATGLFGDGSAAFLVAGDEYRSSQRPLLEIIDSAQMFFKNSKDLMGWAITNTGFKIILSAGVPEVAQDKMPPIIDSFLEKHQLKRKDIKHWVAHPGGPKVISALEKGLNLDKHALDHTKASLKEVGNLSSVSVLNVLERTLQQKTTPGDLGLLFAMGPGFCTELVLFKC